ncbi:MAG: uroporphyrinogen decarboxylase family protein [Chloroflexota bacterium]|nr:uroporphyrinogen decarboxylase family protein [Chloroflexota bacterium]
MNQPRFAFFQQGARLMADAMVGIADHVPVYAQMHDFAVARYGADASCFYNRAALLVPALLQAQAAIGLDVASITFDVYNIEAEALGQALIRGSSGMPDIDRRRPLIRDRADLRRIKTPDFASAGRFANVIEMYRLFRELTGIEPTLAFCAPFTLATNLRGIEQFLVDIYLDPDFAHNLLDRVTEEVLVPWIRFQQRQFPAAVRVSGADATASFPIINTDILRDWALPPIQRLRALCGPGVYVANWAGEHCSKAPDAILNLKRLANPDWVQGQDPDVDRLGPAFYKRYAQRHDLPLILGVGAAFLAEASPAAVRDRVSHYVKEGSDGGRFALYLCNVGATTPLENVKAAIETAHQYVTR